MSIKFLESIRKDCIRIEGSMTSQHFREIENFIISMMRRYSRVKIDLSAVNEIDRCGVHLLTMLKNFGGDGVDIFSTSPVVDAALAHMRSARRHPHSTHLPRRDIQHSINN